MPYIKIDYDEKKIDDIMPELVDLLKASSMEIYRLGEEKVSIFTAPYGKYNFSTSVAEIEVRVGDFEYDSNSSEMNKERSAHIERFERIIEDFLAAKGIKEGIVFSITLEHWKAEWFAAE